MKGSWPEVKPKSRAKAKEDKEAENEYSRDTGDAEGNRRTHPRDARDQGADAGWAGGADRRERGRVSCDRGGRERPPVLVSAQVFARLRHRPDGATGGPYGQARQPAGDARGRRRRDGARGGHRDPQHGRAFPQPPGDAVFRDLRLRSPAPGRADPHVDPRRAGVRLRS